MSVLFGNALLPFAPPLGAHSAVLDAFHSMSLFNSYRTVQTMPALLRDMQQRTLTTPVTPPLDHDREPALWTVT